MKTSFTRGIHTWLGSLKRLAAIMHSNTGDMLNDLAILGKTELKISYFAPVVSTYRGVYMDPAKADSSVEPYYAEEKEILARLHRTKINLAKDFSAGWADQKQAFKAIGGEAKPTASEIIDDRADTVMKWAEEYGTKLKCKPRTWEQISEALSGIKISKGL